MSNLNFFEQYLSSQGKGVEPDKIIVSSNDINKEFKQVIYLQTLFFLKKYWNSLLQTTSKYKEKWVSELLEANITDDINYESKALGAINRCNLYLLHGHLNSTRRLQINKALEKKIATKFFESKDDGLKEIQNILHELKRDLENHQLIFYTLQLNDDSSLEKWHVSILKITQWTTEVTETIADLTKYMNLIIEKLLSKNNRSFAEKVGRVNAELGYFSRLILSTEIGVLKLFLEKKQDNGFEFDAKKIPFKGNTFPNGKNKAIHQIVKCEDDDFVETGGFIKKIEAFRTHDKSLVCRASLYDPSSKKSIWITIPFVHLRHLGIEVNSYCHVNGTVKHQSNLAKQELAIHLDRLSLSSLKKESWITALLYSSKNFYQAWYSGLNIKWSLSLQTHNVKTKKIISMGAGELIYQPTVRDEAFQEYRSEKY
jgi:hypothetical protein